jgi:hypothetical protein
MLCPNCGLDRPDDVLPCDCGYDFVLRGIPDELATRACAIRAIASVLVFLAGCASLFAYEGLGERAYALIVTGIYFVVFPVLSLAVFALSFVGGRRIRSSVAAWSYSIALGLATAVLARPMWR